ASCLAVWRVGAAYLPLDISYPADRLSFMVADSSASAVIVDDHDDAASLGANDAQIIAVSALTATPENASEAAFKETSYDGSAPAYVIYTSGSTGQPKGVVNGFSQLTNFLSAMAKTPGLAENDTLLAVTTLSFDISILECFLPLCVGGTVSLASSDEVADPFCLIEKLKEDRVTVMQATPSTWRLLIDAGWEGDPSITALSGGEALDPTLADDLLRRTKSLWNMYGPTETTVWSSYSRVKAGDCISVGKPFGGNTFHILDRSREVRPVGVPGELWIGGTNVSKGYLERPELNAERFVTIGSSEEGQERCYKTGDIAVWTEAGDCRVLGRVDSQIKLRGHRIELEEIDAGLHSIPDLVEGAAAIRQDAAGEAALAAFVVFPDGDDVPTASDLRRKLRTVLPSYMLPQYFQPLDALPRLPNGKLDRKSLPEIATVGIQHREKAPPSTPNEIAIADVWQSVLGVDSVSVTDNFFELGGQSLQAAQMVSQLKREQGISIPLRAAIFETLEQLAASSTGGAAATKAS
ncbi:MAG: non-ribosomal peptide synthetase, partial [Pseudomonadota bacterium]